MWTPTAKYGRQQLMSFPGNLLKRRQRRQRICRERLKKEEKFPIFGLIDFSNFDSYWTIGSPI
jgi:hypothetical protein